MGSMMNKTHKPEQRQYYFYIVFNDDSEQSCNCRSKKDAVKLYKNFDSTPYNFLEWEQQPREWGYHYNAS